MVSQRLPHRRLPQSAPASEMNYSPSMTLSSVRPWGPGTTLALALLLILLLTGIEAVAGFIYAMQFLPEKSTTISMQQWLDVYRELDINGDFLSIILLMRTVIGIGLIIWLCRVRAPAMIRGYLALHSITIRQILFGIITLVIFILCTEVLYNWLDRDSLNDFMQETYESTQHVTILWIAVIVAAPIFEELFFRGFLYAGLSQSRLGNIGTILLTAMIFALSHLQYDWPEMIVVLCLGIILGMARWRSGSVVLPMILHSLNNLAATIQLAS